jgi:hypothetical protein
LDGRVSETAKATVVETELPPRVAVTVTDSFVENAPATAVKAAELADAGTEMEAGTVNAVEVSLIVAVAPPAGAA